MSVVGTAAPGWAYEPKEHEEISKDAVLMACKLLDADLARQSRKSDAGRLAEVRELICAASEADAQDLYAGTLLDDEALRPDYIPTSPDKHGILQQHLECEPHAPGRWFEPTLANVALRKSDFCPALPRAYERLHHVALNEANKGSAAKQRAATAASPPRTLASVAQETRQSFASQGVLTRDQMLLQAIAWELYALHFFADLFATGHQVAEAPVENSIWAARSSGRAVDYWNDQGLELSGEGLDTKAPLYLEFQREAQQMGLGRCAESDHWMGYGGGRLQDQENAANRCRLVYGAVRSLLSVMETYVTGEAPSPQNESQLLQSIAPSCMKNETAEALALQAAPPLRNEVVLNAAFSGLSGLFQKYDLQYGRSFWQRFAVGVAAGTLGNSGRTVFSRRGWFVEPDLTFFFTYDPYGLFTYVKAAPYLANLSPAVGFFRYEGSALSLGYGACMRFDDYLGMAVRLEVSAELRQSPEDARKLRPGFGGGIYQGVCF